jgi:uncharacterized protein YyaL (SSP411 family)
MANRLIHSTSPYLQQHAHNPVDWFEWGPEALNKAKAEDKPIIVSIGYSACHWCHVMERESFENEDIAHVMNEHFVCIKVDREERPDIDQVYMEAVQALQIHGGWPLNVFLTPDQQPFHGGTYFPPPGWKQLLLRISQVFKAQRTNVDQAAKEITAHINRSDLARFAARLPEGVNATQLDKMFHVLHNRFDHRWGGMDKAPKFVMPVIWLFLLRYHYITGSKDALHMVTHTLTQMTRAALYDLIGGGFARYSVDAEWFAPHFEKMLYDNAQLLSLYAEAKRAGTFTLPDEIIPACVNWLEHEMTHRDGGFYSALDADSEGVEGKFYTWTWQEAKDALGGELEKSKDWFKLTETGNWEHGRNILMKGDGRINASHWKALFMKARSKRIRPGLDDKILAGWNAMTVIGLVDCYKAFGEVRYRDLALKGITFIEQQMIRDGVVYRSFRGKLSSTEGFLEDYAFLVKSYVALYQVTFDETWISKGAKLAKYVIDHFYDTNEGYFQYTSSNAENLIARKKEIFDNVIPSSNSVMAQALFDLGVIVDDAAWKDIAVNMTTRLAKIMEEEPAYMSNWATLLATIVNGQAEVVIIGPDCLGIARDIHRQYFPFAILMGAVKDSTLPLVSGRDMINNNTTIYVCFNKACRLPVNTVAEAVAELRRQN